MSKSNANLSVKNQKLPTVVSVLNLKGGVGKTTVTALLARYAAGAGGFSMRGQKSMNVLAVDLDPQANLSQALMGEVAYKKFHDDGEPSVVELFNNFVPPSSANPAPSPVGGDVVKTLPNAAGVLEILPSRFDFSRRLIESTRGKEENLAQFIKTETPDKDLVLIDCAPTESALTRMAYHASQYVLIPVRTEFLATIGFPLMKESLDLFCKDYRRTIQVCGVVVNRNRTSGVNLGPHHRSSLGDIGHYAKKYKWPIVACMDHSDGYPKWAKDANANHLGNAPREWPSIAEAILQSVGLAV